MSTTMVWVVVGVVAFAFAVAVQGAKEEGCGGAIAGFVGVIAIAALCIAGCRNGCAKSKDSGTDGDVAESRAAPDNPKEGSGVPHGGSKLEKLRAFSLAEAPAAWETYQTLAAEVELQDKRLDALRAELVEFGRNPEEDDDFRELSRQLQDMRVMRDNVLLRLEAAYIAARKCEATPGRRDLDELRRTALQDGIQEAEAASRRFRQMRSAKE